MVSNVDYVERDGKVKPNISVCGISHDRELFLERISTVIEDSDIDVGILRKESAQKVSKRYFSDETRESNSAVQFVANRFCNDENPQCGRCPLRYLCDYRVSQTTTSPPTFAEFFSGAGGLSLGFEQSGFDPVLAVEQDPWFAETYARNRSGSGVKVIGGDVEKWIEEESYESMEADVVVGGVPCQSFSMANRQRAEDDPRDTLYESFVRAAAECNPGVIILENVEGMKRVAEPVKSDLESRGYAVNHLELDAMDYGLPQRRKRLFFIAVSRRHYRDAESASQRCAISISKEQRRGNVSLHEAIGDLPKREPTRVPYQTDYESDETGYALEIHDITNAPKYVNEINGEKELTLLFNHKSRYNNDRDIEIFDRLPQGGDSLDPSIRDIMPYKDRDDVFKDKYFRLEYDKPCRTITAHMRYDCNMYIHPTQPRGLTVREAARVQGFPDDYVFVGTFQRLYQQVGNAVPPPLAKIIATAIREEVL